MPDDTDELAGSGPRTPSEPQSVSWPLVERRRSNRTPPGGLDRRSLEAERLPDEPTLSAAPLWPFRLAALAGALIRAAPDLSWRNWSLVALTVATSAFTLFVCRRPVPYRNDAKVRLRIVVEVALVTAAVMLSGAWLSPFVFLFIPAGMLAGLAGGGLFSAQVAGVAVAVVTVQHVTGVGVRDGLQDGALWAGLLALVAFTSGLARRSAHEAARQQQVALDRVSRLAEANSLLFALQRVAQTLPASLDLEEVLDSTVGRLRAMLRHDLLAVYLVDPVSRMATPARTHGVGTPQPYHLDRLPDPLRESLDSMKTVRIEQLPAEGGLWSGARSGLYAALRTRGTLVGFVAVESATAAAFGLQQAEVVHGLSEPFGIAIDNARMFRRIRTLAADEERSRIARDLHDHVGSSLALIGFEVDRAISVAADAEQVDTVLHELRERVTAAVADVRDSLYDLRASVTDDRDVQSTVDELLQRVHERSGIQTHVDIRVGQRLPLLIEREVWQIIREAIVNAERHSDAEHLMVAGRRAGDTVVFTVRDDGVGLDSTNSRHDSYGLLGMRERAHRIGANLTVEGLASGGTEARLELHLDGELS